MTPYLAGTKKALCVPMRKTVDSTMDGPRTCISWAEPSQKPSKATRVMPISAIFQKTSEFRLLYRSAR